VCRQHPAPRVAVDGRPGVPRSHTEAGRGQLRITEGLACRRGGAGSSRQQPCYASVHPAAGRRSGGGLCTVPAPNPHTCCQRRRQLANRGPWRRNPWRRTPEMSFT
jgi:hypothetical protein